ncbi:transporter [Siphonobacter sp. BAB-5385]|uniref:ComEA family DNA-binding protein n=1 Tax=Siphonobacter sp. BAB-5385 TaxID=1864822 RepID=UPI000B9E692B|nr:helix-hairpin-helix domain-containing protein [Siphonobacter sp. BAB-5385]OZI06462.1 transporter [Siphonobacter sp. BAB-5385]
MPSKLTQWIRNYFGFSRTESRGFLVLLCLLIILLISPFVLDFFPDSVQDSQDAQKLDTLMAQLEVQSETQKAYSEHDSRDYNHSPDKRLSKPTRLFAFDPNTITSEQWQELGVARWMAERIVKYRSKGGVFRKKEDLLRIYDFPEEQYRQLEAYIRLPATPTSFSNPTLKSSTETRSTPSKADRTTFTFQLNEADTTDFKKVYGIGSKLALRIIKFRESLGGFVNENQLREVWGLDSTVVQELLKHGRLTGPGSVRKIKINEVSLEQFRHPYLKPYVAKAILAYRQQHGDFQSAADLKAVKLLDEGTLKKLEPYLAF